MSLMTIVTVLTAAGNPGASTASYALSPETSAVEWQAQLVPAHYAMSALLAAYQARDPLFPDALDMTGIDSQKHLLALVAGMNADATEAILRATRQALLQRMSQSSGKTLRWLRRKLQIVEATMRTLGIAP